MRETGTRSYIEFHDSWVEGVVQKGDVAIVTFSKVIIHKSTGNPGVDPGTVWLQRGVLEIREAAVAGKLPEDEDLRYLNSGSLSIGDRVYANGFAIPFRCSGSTRVNLVFVDGEELTVTGKGASFSLPGEPTYLENFSG